MTPIYEDKGEKFINVMMYPLKLRNGITNEEIILNPSGVLINGVEKKVVVREVNGITFKRTEYIPEENSTKRLEELESKNPGATIIGSVKAAQAYPGRVVSYEVFSGYEKVPIDNRIYYANEFQTFEK